MATVLLAEDQARVMANLAGARCVLPGGVHQVTDGEDAGNVDASDLCPAHPAVSSPRFRSASRVGAHLTDRVLSRMPVRPRVLSVPKRLRPCLHGNREVAGRVLDAGASGPGVARWPGSRQRNRTTEPVNSISPRAFVPW